MKKYLKIIMFLFIIICLSGCGFKNDNVAGKVYTYEKEGIGGEFKIYINEDGTFTYYEGLASSYFGVGIWNIDNSVITLTDDDVMGYGFVNYFQIDGDNLLFIEDGSDNFLYVNVKDGEKFTGELFESGNPQISSLIIEK